MSMTCVAAHLDADLPPSHHHVKDAMALSALRSVSTALTLSLLLVGCGGRGDAASPSTDKDSNAAAAEGEANADKPAPTPLPQADLAKPLAEYRKLDSGQQVMFLYAAMSRLPTDFDTMASLASQEYRGTADTFRRKDLMGALRPQLEQSIADAGRSPYYWSELEDADLQAYDFERKGFPVGEFNGGKYRYFMDIPEYSYTWANPAQVQLAPVADETVARQLEGLRSRWNSKPRLRTYFFVQSADLNQRRINAYVTHVQLLDRSGRVLASYSPDPAVAAQPAEEDPCVSPEDCARRALGN